MSALIDSGATDSCVAKRLTEKHPEYFDRRKVEDGFVPLDVLFANDEQEQSSALYSNVCLHEPQSGRGVTIEKLHELTLPAGIDFSAKNGLAAPV